MEQWQQEFRDELEEAHGEAAGHAFDATLAAAAGFGVQVRRQTAVPTKGRAIAILDPRITSWDATVCVGHAGAGTIGWEFLRLRKYNPFRIRAREDELRDLVRDIAGYKDRPDYPCVPWASLEGDALSTFIASLGWTVERIRKANPAG